MPTVSMKAGPELSTAVLHGLLRLRSDVFIVEQGIIYADIDGKDLRSSTTHFWVSEDGDIASCLRVVPEGSGARVGRVCTRHSRRRLGYGIALLKSAVQEYGGAPLILDGQLAVVDFYRAAGFVPAGPEFIDDGIPHVPMRWEGRAGMR